MFEADKAVDYFLFNAGGKLVRFVINDSAVKGKFRFIRGMVVTQPDDIDIGAMEEYLLKLMSGYSGLHWDIILKQLCADYGDNTAQILADWKRKTPPGREPRRSYNLG